MTENGRLRLKAKIAERGETQADLAAAIGISLSRLNAKLNRKNGAEFNQGEITAVKSHFSLTAEEVDAIFF